MSVVAAFASLLIALCAANVAVADTNITLTSDPVPISWGPNHIDVFARGSDGALWHRAFLASSGGWGNWESLGGQMTGTPSVISWSPGHLDVFVRGTDGGLYHRWFTGSGWYDWRRIGTWQIAGSPSAMTWGSGQVDVFARGNDNALIHAALVTSMGDWGDFTSLAGSIQGDPHSISWYSGHIDTFVRAWDNTLFHKYFTTAVGWSGWGQLGTTPIITEPQPVTWGNGQIDVFAEATNGELIHNSFLASLCGWCGWTSLGGGLTSEPRAISWTSGHEEVFVRGGEGNLWQRYFFNGGWSDWESLGRPATGFTGNPRPVTWGYGHVDVMARTSGGELVHRAFLNSSWSDWQSLGIPHVGTPTSWQYGGPDHSVNTTDEQSVVETLLEDDDPSVAATTWSGLSPLDQAGMNNYDAGGIPVPSSSNDQHGGETAAEVPANAASTGPDPTYVNTISLGNCGGVGFDRGIVRDAPPTYPVPPPYTGASRLSWKVSKREQVDGQWAKAVTVDIRVYPWLQHRPGLVVGLATQTGVQVGATNRKSPFKTSVQRDDQQNRFPRKPFYYHLTQWAFEGQNVYMQGTTMFGAPLKWYDAAQDKTFAWAGDFYPTLSKNLWYSCTA
ncbi:hypothetical protein [Conexibacter woesei]|uniref:hypothetical protein n=1 Tax=Conexibacter woesei TaxID=191495 RepID=UPI0006844CB5|nr:hypothetical protein [Conexibacter woesei]